MISLTDDEIVVEPPTAMGTVIDLEPGIELIAAIAIGQNRWMFHTRTLGPPTQTPTMVGGGRPARVLRLAIPTRVERCMRRNFYRISTAELSLPAVECWPLLEPASAIAAELANRVQIVERRDAMVTGVRPRVDTEPVALPDVGPRFNARLVNVGGGGAGLLIDRTEASASESARLVWLRVDLTPYIPLPLAITARIVHTHLDSSHNVYAGAAFEFAFNPSHRHFVVEQVCAYVAALQKQQARVFRRIA